MEAIAKSMQNLLQLPINISRVRRLQMNSLLQEISLLVEDFGSAPKLEEMPKRTLADKGIAGRRRLM